MRKPDDGKEATMRLLRDAIRADVHARVDTVMGRLEDDIEALHGVPELERAIERALADVTDVMAEGIVAQLREVQRLDREG